MASTCVGNSRVPRSEASMYASKRSWAYMQNAGMSVEYPSASTLLSTGQIFGQHSLRFARSFARALFNLELDSVSDGPTLGGSLLPASLSIAPCSVPE